MKLLLDENIDVSFRQELVGHDVSTVTYMKWNGTKNGTLLALAAANGFDALITTDQNMEYQQNIATIPCSIVVLDAKTNDIDDLRPLVPAMLTTLSFLTPRSVVHVG